jgi:hypothetical protein
MASSPAAVERRIAKLLQLARDQEGTPEGETAARIARKLMRDSARDRARAWSQRSDITILQRRFELGARWPWRRRLAAAVAKHCACVAAWPRRGTHVILFGAAGTLDIADYLLVVLLREVDEARAGWLAEQPDYDPSEPLPPDLARRSTGFCNSAIGAIEARLRAMRQEESTVDPTGHALVLAEAASVQDWLRDQGIDLKKGAPDPYAFSREGWHAGHGIALHDAVATPDTPAGRQLRARRCQPRARRN